MPSAQWHTACGHQLQVAHITPSSAVAEHSLQVDGNIHRLLCRLLALHAPATSPILLKKLWSTAQKLVDSLPAEGAEAGDLNQALMELGSQICKPSNPDCGNCPLRTGCNAYSEVSVTEGGAFRVLTLLQ